MRSVKPGRGPSLIGGFVGIFMIGFGIVWTIMAARIHIAFALFGALWTAVAIAITVYNFKNATNKNRYSMYDITDSREEPDPLQSRFSAGLNTTESPNATERPDGAENTFCPYCGTGTQKDYKYCRHCGRRLP